ncbi:MAG: NAD(P)/FAD-dependent oxidoreductase, partial [bacterium]
PDRLCGIAFHRADVDPEKRLGNLSRDEIKRIALAFTAMPLSLKGVCGFAVAHATAGGVPLDEVRYQTMESRIARGLYLAGEVLDVDGQTGGYNFQWAWSTGFLAGRAAALSLKSIS